MGEKFHVTLPKHTIKSHQYSSSNRKIIFQTNYYVWLLLSAYESVLTLWLESWKRNDTNVVFQPKKRYKSWKWAKKHMLCDTENKIVFFFFIQLLLRFEIFEVPRNLNLVSSLFLFLLPVHSLHRFLSQVSPNPSSSPIERRN